MIPTEHEYTEATHAAAKVRYAQHCKANPDQALPEDWDELPPHLKRTFLENVLPIVDAAISAIPDRAAPAWTAGAHWAYDIHPGDQMSDDDLARESEEYLHGLTR